MIADDTYSLTIDGADVEWLTTRVEAVEGLCAPFRFTLTASHRGASAPPPQELVTRQATLTWQCPGHDPRTVHGVVDEVQQSVDGWQIALVPKVALLDDCVDHQIFVDEAPVDVVTAMLDEHGISVDNRCVRSTEPRRQLVQAFESDLSFAGRMLGDEGIVWWCHPSEQDTVVIAGDPDDFPELAGGSFMAIEESGMAQDDSVYDLQLVRHTCPDKVTLRDYDFEKPSLDLTAEYQHEGSEGRFERYEYRAHYTDAQQGRQIAERRLQAYRARHKVLTGKTRCRHLLVGHLIELDAIEDEMDGTWLITEVRHLCETNAGGAMYTATFEAVPKDAGYRPERAAEPRLGGVQNMVVTGPSGAEIHTEEAARVRAHFRWDRRRPLDDTSSAWMRVVQPPTSGGVMMPRMGWEVLSGFWGSSGTDPVMLGRLYNGSAPPPNALPGDKVVTAFGTQTTPGGGGGNLLAFNDTAGGEMVTINASKDLNERTEHDKITGITADETISIGSNRTVTVGKVHGLTVNGSQTRSVSASRTVNVGANKMVNSGNETVAIGGARIFDVGGDHATESASLARVVGAAKAEACIEHQSVLVTGAMTTLIGGSWSQLSGLTHDVSVGGIHKEEVAALKSIKASKYGLSVRGAINETYASSKLTAGGDIVYDYGAAGTVKVGGSAKMEGSKVVFTADSKITLKAGGLTIVITPGEVKIKGNIKSSSGAADDSNETYG